MDPFIKKALPWISFILLINFAVPPFQNPDEPQHFAAIMRFARGQDKSEETNKDIIRFMDRGEWWRFIGIGHPTLLPDKLEKVPFLMGYYNVTDYTILLNEVLLYHFLIGKSLGILAENNIGLAYYLARFITILIFAGALFLLYSLFSSLESNLGLTNGSTLFGSGFLFILFMPQFIVAACAVNPDSLSIFIGAIFFYMAFSLLIRGQKASYMIGLFLAAICGVVLDRSNFLLIPLSFLAVLLSTMKKNWRKTLTVIFIFVASCTALYLALHFLLPAQVEKAFLYAKSNLAQSSFGSIFSLEQMNRTFLRGLMDSFLLKFGWSAYESIPIAYLIWKISIAISGIGILFWLARVVLTERKGRGLESVPKDALSVGTFASARLPRMVIFSMMAVFLQVLAIRLVVTPDNLYMQGRYFFPLIAPIAFLFVLGVKSFFDPFSKKAELGVLAVKAFLILEFFFLNYALWHDIIPVFHMTLKSAHPGI